MVAGKSSGSNAKKTGVGVEITLRVDGASGLRKALDDIGRKAPRAMALSLNRLADDVQAEVKKGLASRFTVRRSAFVQNTIFRKGDDFATNTRLRAQVRVNPDRNFLAKFEEGGRKGPRSGTSVAIPLEAVKPTPMTVVQARMRPAALRMNQQVRKITTPAGTFLVKNRPGRGKGQMTGWRTEFLYKLRPSVPIRPRLDMHSTALRVVSSRAKEVLMMGVDAAIIGLSGRLR
jgi:hypothetical protein